MINLDTLGRYGSDRGFQLTSIDKISTSITILTQYGRNFLKNGEDIIYQAKRNKNLFIIIPNIEIIEYKVVSNIQFIYNYKIKHSKVHTITDKELRMIKIKTLFE